MHRVNVRTRQPALLGLTLAALVAAGCSEIQEPLPEALSPQLAPGEFSGPRSVPTRGRILFSSFVTGDEEIYSVLEDGTGLVRLTYSPGDDGYATWSPDARRIAFVSERSGSDQIYAMNPDGSGAKKLTGFPAGTRIEDLRWSPDGRRLAFSRYEPGEITSDIYTVSTSGKGLLRLTNRDGNDIHPAWSPDGRTLLFASTAGGTYQTTQILQIDADGANEVLFIGCIVMCYNPAWAPDGARVLFRKGLVVSIYHLSGQSVPIQENSSNGVFSPDAVKIAYVDTEANHPIIVADANGVNKTQITTINAVSQLDWGR
jgi:Tol biopolymer transport system component